MNAKALFNRAAAMADDTDQAPIIDAAQPLLFLANARRVAAGVIANAFQSDAQRKAVFAKMGRDTSATSRLKRIADKSKRESDALGEKRDFRYGGKEDLNKRTREQIDASGPSKDAGGSSSGETPTAAGSGAASTKTIYSKPTQEAQGAALGQALIKAIESGKIDPATTPAPWIDGLGNFNPAWGPLFSGPMKQLIIDAWVAAGGQPPDMGGMESIAPMPEAEPAVEETKPQETVIQSPAIISQPADEPEVIVQPYAAQMLTTPAPIQFPTQGAGIVTPAPTPTPTPAEPVETNYGATTGSDGGSPHWYVPERELMRRKNKQQAEAVMEKMKTMPLNLSAAKRLIRNAVRVAADETIANAFGSSAQRRAFFAKQKQGAGARGGISNPPGTGEIVKPLGFASNPAGTGPIQSALGAKPATQFDPATGTWSATPRPPANEGRIMQIIAGRPQPETVAPNKWDATGMALGPAPGTVPATMALPRKPTGAEAVAAREAEANKIRWAAEAEARRIAKEKADAAIAENAKLWADPEYVAAQKKKTEDAKVADQAARKAKKQAELDNYNKVMAERRVASQRAAYNAKFNPGKYSKTFKDFK